MIALGGFYLFVFIVVLFFTSFYSVVEVPLALLHIRDAGILLLIITALRLRLVRCYEKSHLFEVIYRSYLYSPNELPSKQWVQIWHLGSPMALQTVSRLLNFKVSTPMVLRIVSTMRAYCGVVSSL